MEDDEEDEELAAAAAAVRARFGAIARCSGVGGRALPADSAKRSERTFVRLPNRELPQHGQLIQTLSQEGGAPAHLRSFLTLSEAVMWTTVVG